MIDIALLVTIIGCFLSLAKWIDHRDKKISIDSEWKGSVNAKLDNINNGVTGVNDRLTRMEGKYDNHENRITVLETTIGVRRDKNE